MGETKAKLREFRDAIAAILEEEVRPILPDLGDYKLTFIARIEDHPESDILVSQDGLVGLMEALDRRFKGKEV